MLNYISFASIVGGFVIYGADLIYQSYCESKDIYFYVEELEEDESALFEIYHLIEKHHV